MVRVYAHENPIMDKAESDLAKLSVVKAIVLNGYMNPGKQDLRQCKGNAMLHPVGGVFSRIEYISHN